MSIQSAWDAASAEVKAKYLKFEGSEEFDAGDVFREASEFSDVLKAMASPFYCEQSDRYNTNAVQGCKTEEEALDLLIDGADKYGDWQIYKFNDGQWLEAKVKRKGKSVELLWSVREY